MSARYATCTICFEPVPRGTRYPPPEVSTCKHTTCLVCFRRYLNETLTIFHQSNYETVLCPDYGCRGKFNTGGVIDKVYNKKEAAEWWEKIIKRTCIPNKIYCPMENCGAVMEGDKQLKQTCTFIICHQCNRGFCSACQKKWHQTKKINDNKSEEKMTLKTAKDNNWARCPKCRGVVERLAGCLHMRCLCGVDFCYRCGRLHTVCKDSCQKYRDDTIQELRDDMFT